MFDGNHRSRRTINLSKSTRRNRASSSSTSSTAGTSRSTILQKSKEQREKRLQENRRLQAVKTIQKVYRGYQYRVSIIHLLLGSSGAGGKEGRCLYPIVLRDRLSSVERFGGLFLSSLIPFVEDIRILLIRFVKEIKLQTQTPLSIEDDRYLFYRRVVVQALIVLQRSATSVNTNTDEENRLLMNLISSIFDSASMSTLKKMMGQHHSKHTNMSQIEMELITCLRNWFWNSSTSTNVTTAKSQNGALFSMDLLKIANQISQLESKNEFRGYLAALILGVDMDSSRKIYTQMQCQIDELEWYISLFETLYSIMQKDKNHMVLAGREVIILKNALVILSKLHSHSHNPEKLKALKLLVIQLMGLLFDPISNWNLEGKVDGDETSMQIRALVILSGLAAKGVNLDTLLKGGLNQMEIVDLTGSDDDSDDDEDRDVEMEQTSETVHHPTRIVITTSRTNRPSTSRKLRRQDLQTTHKLNQNYKVKLTQAQNEVVIWLQGQGSSRSIDPAIVKSLHDIAKGIGGGDIIVQLASAVFQKNDNSQNHLRGIFCTTLSMALQNCSGIKERDSAMSPLLSKLAFNQTFMEELWAYVRYNLPSLSSRNTETEDNHAQEVVNVYSAITCFCDLFSHQLLALNDEDFLLSFTDMNPNEKAGSRISAVDVIEIIKQQLYEVYWSKPIIADDYIVPSSTTAGCLGYEAVAKYHRARVLLSGTKLWNSIYVRWSRLYRTKKFCEEELWFFPHLVTRDQDESGAVDPRAAVVDLNMDEDDDSINSAMEIEQNGNTQADTENESMASSFKDPKMARILTSIPQALPFDRRAKLFSSLLSADILKTQDETAAMQSMMWNMQRGIEGAEFTGRERVKIRRDKLYNDSMESLNKLGPRLKRKVQVTFISQHGNEEAGVDGGGLFKEFLDDLIKHAFDPTNTLDRFRDPLFLESPLQTLAVNTSLAVSSHMLTHYQFLGRVLGKAVYESILVEPQFCLPLLNQLLGQHNTIDDLKNLDPVYYKHLNSLRQMTSDQINSLDLTFEMTAPSDEGSSRTVELIPGGSSIRVTKENAVRYVHLVAHRRLNIETVAQINAMRDGFRDLIPASWVRLFSPYELQKVISGDDTIKGFDVKGLKNAMEYGGGYHPSQPIMVWFWEVIEEMTPTQKNQFLKFVTSCSRQPLLGFRALSPLPCVHQVRLQEGEENRDVKDLRLPTSSTCMNLLKLPNYKSKEILRSKLLYAIESGAGFELS